MILPFHPCMNHDAHYQIPRLHLPVAPKCNLSCRFCKRDIDPKNSLISAPGVATEIMTPEQSIEKTGRFLNRWGMSAIVGIAGPGDPLANPETLETFRLIRKRYQNVNLCICTNGLNLPEAVPELKRLNVKYLTVTVNGLDPAIVAKIQPWINKNGTFFKGHEGARILIQNQLEGIQAAVKTGLIVKVNSVVVPGINEIHIAAIAQKARNLGATVINPMPLIPRGGLKKLKAPSSAQMRFIYKVCETQLPVFKLCRQCRADAEGIPGKEQNLCR